MKASHNWYIQGCKFTVHHFSRFIRDIDDFSAKAERSVSQQYRDSITFTGFVIEPFETVIFSYAGTFATLVLLLLFDTLLFQITTFDRTILTLVATLTIALPLCVLLYLSEYVKIHARYMKIQSIGDIPEVLSYVVMSMRLVSNMEKAVHFAASHSNRPLAYDLRKMLWNLQVRVYSNIDDALLDFADMWGKNSEHFKRSLHLIKSSISEPDEAQRIITLNRALDIVLDGTKELMEQFAARLKTPTYILYSIFILIPLALVALLPAMTVVGFKFDIVTLVILYDIILPLATFVYAEYILMQRPATFVPQNIPDIHPGLKNIGKKKRNAFIVATITGTLIGISGYAYNYAGNPFNIISTETLNGILPPTLLIIWGIVIAFSIYMNAAYSPYKRIRDEIKMMENEFADALFILGRRISEGRAAEEAFAHTARTVQGSHIGKAFERISTNLITMRTDIRTAIFDEEFGAFRDIYSDRIQTTMVMFTESIHKSHQSAGIAIIKLADHLKELQVVEQNIKHSLYDMTSTMRTTAIIFAPLIAGVTIALSEVISKILQNIAKGMSRLPQEIMPGPANISPENLDQTIAPELFMLAIGIYLILITAILTRFSSTIENGGDRTQFMYDLGQALPISIIVFTVTAITARTFFRGLI
ncbi:hypothetical protein [Methanococcoides alaskense]|uniref:Flp pilus assembly protein TadB n=1 Tax=Methanococcoides alaskense TaxID=325778 RepID=A0AA90TZ50_9EURY|nr:hypothetical protein [Methanococcoides alaskense]MDR6222687.1 Flp pilus assembly protein TadB [Methanococcoides alaskense]